VDLTRRGFLAMAGSAALVPFDRAGSEPAPEGWVVVEPGRNCPIPESVGGYAGCLAALGVPATLMTAEGFGARRMPDRAVVVPASVVLPPLAAKRLVEAAGRGTIVLIESGLGYAGPAEGAAGREALAGLGITAHDTVTLRTPTRAGFRVPYVEFTWPTVMQVRDFSRVVPLSGPGWHVVASVRGLSAGLARRVGRGAIVVLGSPVGPALACGDREARGWLASFLERSANPRTVA
jgi:hypothetical protein